MKYIILTILLGTFIVADEMDRMESIVVDIENLRSNYNRCIKELSVQNTEKTILNTDAKNVHQVELEKNTKAMYEYKNLLDEERRKNQLLTARVDSLNKINAALKDDNSNKNKIKILKIKENSNKKPEKIDNLENMKIKYENILKDKDNMIISLKNQNKTENKTKIIKKEICKDENSFPPLMMKNSINEKTPKEKKVLEEEIGNHPNKLELKTRTSAKTYRLNKDSKIYDDVDGNIIFEWENKTSFTSVHTTQNWLEISGYFVDRKWGKSKRSLWVHKINATER